MSQANQTPPLDKILQILVVLFYSHLTPLFATFTYFLLYNIRYSWAIILPYVIWANTVDKRTPFRGGSDRYAWFRDWKAWDYFKDYFEAEFVKTVDLDPSKNYLFGSHPHGVYCYGLLPSFISTRSLRKVFPGLNVRISTLDVNWFIPFWREIQIAFGTCSVSRKSLEHVLTKMGPGASVVIVVGGAAEALRARKGTNDILLGRKGFVKVAIQTGASLVPTFTFGENDLYHQLTPETWPPIASFHTWMKKKLTFSVPLIWGAFWFFPRKVKMAVVAGAPIEVEKQADPSDEYINEIHKQYVKALEELYDAHKERFAKGRRRDLKIFDALE